MAWTEEQSKIIEGLPSTRILVDAGPGTGKTDVACARIAWLINNANLNPADIWVVSFTRTAVHELRNRIGSYLTDPNNASGIKIATVDSHSWSIQSGFNSEAALTGSYEDNIKSVINLIVNNEGVFQYIRNARHLVIDEAQDLIGLRSELLLELINALDKNSGVTILSDEAQAIYGFSEDETAGERQGTLPECIRKYMDDTFEKAELTKIHRTSDKTLLDLYSNGRSFLKAIVVSPDVKLNNVRELIEGNNHNKLGSHRTDLAQLPENLDDAFLLFRRRGEALEASGYLQLRPHRLRLSGLPPMIDDWIGLLFWDWEKTDITKSEFDQRWAERLSDRPESLRLKSWESLVKHVGFTETRISVSTLGSKLSRGSPHIDFSKPDFGFEGPVVGTIHGAKGREAHQVRLYLPPKQTFEDSGNTDIDEEARILFVGASRARKELMVGHGATKALCRSLEESRRAYTPWPFSKQKKTARAAVEIGRIGDIDATGLVGTQFFNTLMDAKTAQNNIAQLSGSMSNAEAKSCGPSKNWTYAVTCEKFNEMPIAFLSQRVNKDMFQIASKINDIVQLNKLRPPAKISYLRCFGVRTIAVPQEEREHLHAPWRDSGFVLAPLLLGYSIVYFS